MKIMVIFLCYFFILFLINFLLRKTFDKKTRYKDSKLDSEPISILYGFFGVFMFLFIKQIREYRKRYYIQNKVISYEYWILHYDIPIEKVKFPKWDSFTHEDYLVGKRYIKLKKLNKHIEEGEK